MLKIKGLAATLGIAACFGAALLPLTSYADDLSASDTLDVEVNIAPVISMRLESHSAVSGTRTTTCDSHDNTVDPDTGETVSHCVDADIDDDGVGDNNEVRTTLLPASADTTSMYTIIYVTTNSGDGYTLTLNDSDTNSDLSTGTYTIPTIAALPVASTNPGWAVHIDGEQISGVDVWRAMPISTASAIIVKNYQPDPKATVTDDQSKVTYGVATSNDQGSGLYTDTVVYTATTN